MAPLGVVQMAGAGVAVTVMLALLVVTVAEAVPVQPLASVTVTE